MPCGRAGPVLMSRSKSRSKRAIELQPIAVHVDHVDLVIAFDVHDAAGRQVLDEEVVRHDEALVVVVSRR